MLSRDECTIVCKPSAADQKCIRSCTAVQSCGFEVDEHEWRTCWRAARQHGRVQRAPLMFGGNLSDLVTSVRRVRVEAMLDDERTPAFMIEPCAAEHVFEWLIWTACFV